jgi:uncharacterized protein (TIGR01244 family)
MQRHRFLLLSCVAALVAGCGGSGEPTASSETARKDGAPAASTEHKAITTDKLEPYQCGAVQRLHTFGGIFLASQPTAADFEQAKQGGVKTVINLRHAKEQPDFDERATVTALGLAYVSLPWNGPDELTDEIFDRSRELLNTVERPILLHCSSANRVGALWIPWRVLDGGIALEEAVAEAKVVGLKSPDLEAKAKDYVERRKTVKS